MDNKTESAQNSSLICLEKLNSISNFRLTEDGALIDIEAGTSLSELISKLDEDYPEYFFPVDPTEKSASFGGMISTNASGSRGFKYGSIRDWVSALRVVLVNGDILELERGINKLQGLDFSFLDKKHTFKEIYKPKTKNSIGYNYFNNMDLVDLFIGAEGTLGIVTKITLKLIKKPAKVYFILQLFNNYKQALSFIKLLRKDKQIDTLSLEYFDGEALIYASKSNKLVLESFKEFIDNPNSSAVYFEISSTDFDKEFEIISEYLNISEGNIENSIFAESIKEQDDLRRFRHAVPENINKEIARRKLQHANIRKVATDMSVENEYLEQVYELYLKTFKENNLEFVIFGHAGDNHFHVNILPKNNQELELAVRAYEGIAGSIVSMNGAVAAEHGIGRLKKKLLKIQYPSEVIDQMIEIKKIFDPNFRLNNGVLF